MEKGTVEADLFLLRSNIDIWMRNFGVDDGDTLTPEEVSEMLECFFDDMKPKLFALARREDKEKKPKL